MNIVKILNESRLFVNGYNYPYQCNIAIDRNDITSELLSTIDKWCAQNDDTIVMIDILGMPEDTCLSLGEVYASPEEHWCYYTASINTKYIDVCELLNSLGCY